MDMDLLQKDVAGAMINRAFITLDVRSVQEDQRIIEGVASTPKPDRQNDIVEPLGAVYKTPMPLLLDHDHRQAVGQVEFAQATPAGITFRARIAKIDDPGEAKDLVDKAWHLVKAKLRTSVSIGFRSLDGGVELLREGGIRFTKWEWLELSLVSVPAQADAAITSVKRAIDPVLPSIENLSPSQKPSALELFAKALPPVLREFVGRKVGPIEERVAAMERQMEDIQSRGVKYFGVYQPAMDYARGSLVTHDGSMWHANKDTRAKPGTAADWTLAVKRGEAR